MSEKDLLLEYGVAFGKAYERFLEGLKNGEFVYTNEQEIRCYLFSEYIKYLQEQGFPKPYHVFVDYKVDDKIIDLALPIDEGKIIAVEIKHDPFPSGIEEDLSRLKEMIENNIALRGIFVTLAYSDYELKNRLREQGVFSKFGLNEDGESPRGYVEWRTLKTPYHPKLIDALFIILRK
ncbi:MAG: hypothetical protein QXP36_06310 [Conexivisphaerales archaeon]